MNKSQLLLFSIISTSIISFSSAMESDTTKTTTTLTAEPNSHYIPNHSQRLFDICLTGGETVVNPKLTMPIATHNLQKWAYNNRPQDTKHQPTLTEALKTFNTTISSILDTARETKKKKMVICQLSKTSIEKITRSLEVIANDMCSITQAINKAKNITDQTSSEIRTIMIDNVRKATAMIDLSQNTHIIKQELEFYHNTINIATSFLAEDIKSADLEKLIDNEEMLLSEFEKAENQAMDLYIGSRDSTITSMMQNKNEQITTKNDAIKQLTANLVNKQNELEQIKEILKQAETTYKKSLFRLGLAGGTGLLLLILACKTDIFDKLFAQLSMALSSVR